YDSPEAVGGIAIVSPAAGAKRAGSQIVIKRVVVLGNKSLASAKSESFSHALRKGQDSGIIEARIPRAETVHLARRRHACNSRVKRHVCLPNAEQIIDSFVIVVRGYDPIVAELTLNAKRIAAGVRRGEARIDGYWKASWG